MIAMVQIVTTLAGMVAVLTGLTAIYRLATADDRFPLQGSELAVGTLAVVAIAGGSRGIYASYAATVDSGLAFGAVAVLLGVIAVLQHRIDRRADLL